MAEPITTQPIAKPAPEAHLSPQEMTSDQLRQWELDGQKIPRAPVEPDAVAESSPAEPVAQAVSTETIAAPASEPGTPEKKKGKGLDARAQELLADRARERDRADRAERLADDYRTRLAALEAKPKPDAKADPSPAAKADPDWKRYRAMPGAPKVGDFEELEDYTAAMALFIADTRGAEQFESMYAERSKQSEAAAEEQRAFETVVTQAEARIEAAKTADPTLVDRVDPRFKALVPMRLLPEGTRPTPHHYAKDVIMFESEHPLELSVFYSSDEGRAEWTRLIGLPAAQMQRDIAYRDVSFRSETQASGDATAASPISHAPAPPAVLGRKAAAPVDPLKAALAAGDYLAFEKLENARELAGKRS